VLWQGLLLDGHHRLHICKRHKIPFETIDIDLPSRRAAANRIDQNQLGRRNLTPEQVSLLRGRLYNRLKRERRANLKQNSPKCKTCTSEDTAKALAKRHGVSPRTIKNDGQFAHAVEVIEPVVPDINVRVMSGDIPSRQAVIEAAEDPEHAEERLKPHVAQNSGHNEWYTPPEYIEAAKDVLGRIDLDPASTETANAIVGAERIFTAESDGLQQDWAGNVWMNPPYALMALT